MSKIKCYERATHVRVPRPYGKSIYMKRIEFFLTDNDQFTKEMNYKKKVKFVLNENPPITLELYKLNNIYTRPSFELAD